MPFREGFLSGARFVIAPHRATHDALAGLLQRRVIGAASGSDVRSSGKYLARGPDCTSSDPGVPGTFTANG
jgi:hypothetical protein